VISQLFPRRDEAARFGKKQVQADTPFMTASAGSLASLAALVGIACRSLNRSLGQWRSLALRQINRLLPQHHAEQAYERDQRRGRRSNMDKAIGDANDETHDEGDR
jgi:hypothetical protein